MIDIKRACIWTRGDKDKMASVPAAMLSEVTGYDRCDGLVLPSQQATVLVNIYEEGN